MGKRRIEKKNKYEVAKDKGGNDMALLARPCNHIMVIDKKKSQEFLEDSKRNVISSEFLRECQKSASLFKRRDIVRRSNGSVR